jgi:hypothetical protein
MRNETEVRRIDIPEGLRGTLRQYQQCGMNQMPVVRNGARAAPAPDIHRASGKRTEKQNGVSSRDL